MRLPVVFIPHGGGPWPFVDVGFPKEEVAGLADYLRSVRSVPQVPPKAVLVISAHWEEPVPTVMTADHPSILYDYYGFPPESYQIRWPAPGEPRVASRVRALLAAAGFQTAADSQRGYDHGTFIPLKLTYPDADVPTVQLSLKRGLDPKEHIAIGRALLPLRDEGVFIIGSGMTFHNLRAFRPATLRQAQGRPEPGRGTTLAQGAPSNVEGRDPRANAVAEAFDAWLRESATLEADARNRRLEAWESAPSARLAHPREEHLLPLMVAAGAAGEDRATRAFNGTVFGLRLSAFHFGV